MQLDQNRLEDKEDGENQHTLNKVEEESSRTSEYFKFENDGVNLDDLKNALS